jgi:hypothetical protein
LFDRLKTRLLPFSLAPLRDGRKNMNKLLTSAVLVCGIFPVISPHAAEFAISAQCEYQIKESEKESGSLDISKTECICQANVRRDEIRAPLADQYWISGCRKERDSLRPQIILNRAQRQKESQSAAKKEAKQKIEQDHKNAIDKSLHLVLTTANIFSGSYKTDADFLSAARQKIQFNPWYDDKRSPNGASVAGVDGTLDDGTFAAFNARVEQDVDQWVQGKQFVPPEKGEYEKSDAYSKRVADLRAKHDLEAGQRKAMRERVAFNTFNDRLSEEHGKPGIAKLEYDADKGAFDVVISGTKKALPIVGTIIVPSDRAPSIKKSLQTSQPIVVFYPSESNFNVAGAVLLSRDNNIFQVENVAPKTVGKIGPVAAAQYFKAEVIAEKKRAAEGRIRDEESRKAELERAKQYPYMVNFSCRVMGTPIFFAACFKGGGEIQVATGSGTQTLDMMSIGTQQSYEMELPEHFRFAATTGSGRGAIFVEVSERVSKKVTWNGNTGATGSVGLKN